jgi:type I restriction enzyme, S subunit
MPRRRSCAGSWEGWDMASDFKRVRLGDYIVSLPGFAFPSSAFSLHEGLPLVRIRDLERESTETRFRGRYDEKFVLKSDDILVGMDGDFLVRRWGGGAALLNQRVCKIDSDSPDLSVRFLYWLLQPIVERIHRRTAETTVRHLSTRDLEGETVFLPSHAEQRRIAEVLDTLDEAIRKTEQLIAKLKQVKQGLLHDLLTRGIDENGELRDPERHPEQFKKSPLGRIPKAWDVVPFGELVSSTSLGTSKRGRDPLGDNIDLLKMGNLGWGFLQLGDMEQVGRGRVPDWRMLLLEPGDLVFNTRNTPDLVGKTAVWNGRVGQVVPDNNLLRVRFCERMNGFFASAFMANGVGRVRVGQLATGTTSVAAIYWRSLARYLLPVPVREEQQMVVVRLNAVDARLGVEADQLNKLRLLKQGLMEDLLTGRVRVTPLLAGSTP